MGNNKYSPWNIFKESSERYPENIMLIFNGKEFTYTEIMNKVLELSSLIEAWNFTMGGVFLPNCTEFITSMLVLNRNKKAFVSFSYQFKGETLLEMLNYTDVELLITDERGFEMVSDRVEDLNIRYILVLQKTGSYSIYEYQKEKIRAIDGINDDTFGICFTSGSTSNPKGIVLSDYAITGNAMAVAEYLNFTDKDRTIIPRSLAQASPLSGDVLMAISRGGGIILLNNLFHPAIFLKSIQDYKATTFFVVRTMLLQILEYHQFDNYDLSSLKRILVGGMTTPLSVFKLTALKLPHVKIYNAYGSSEASARVSFGEHEEVTAYPCFIGKPMKGCELKIYREDGTEANPGEKGEIYIKSEYIMDGYYKSPKLSEEVLTPKGFRVKDQGYMDKKGRYYALGRNDDLIIQAGNKVYPIDIEEVLIKHSDVRETLVLGIDDEKLGQKIVALVALKTGSNIQTADLYRWCTCYLEDKKIPKEITIVEEIPRNTIGKINKNEIKKIYNCMIVKPCKQN